MKKLALGLAAVLMVCVFAGCRAPGKLDKYFDTLQSVDGMSLGEAAVVLVEASAPLLNLSEAEHGKRNEWERMDDSKTVDSWGYYCSVPYGRDSVQVHFLNIAREEGALCVFDYSFSMDGNGLDEEREIYQALVDRFGDKEMSRMATIDDNSLEDEEKKEILLVDTPVVFEESIFLYYFWDAKIEGVEVSIILSSNVKSDGSKFITISVSTAD